MKKIFIQKIRSCFNDLDKLIKIIDEEQNLSDDANFSFLSQLDNDIQCTKKNIEFWNDLLKIYQEIEEE